MTIDNEYVEFLATKQRKPIISGFDVAPEDINQKLFLFQRDIVRWALRLGKAAVFAECGLGKTPIQLEWARHVVKKTSGKVLILAPLAVAAQTVREGVKFGIDVLYVREPEEIDDSDCAILITNYERLDKFDCEQFQGVVLDESSILKTYTGKTKQAIIASFESMPYKLACTATPAPNDHMELGNHAQFLDVMPSNEMLSRWFKNDTMHAGGYSLKPHGKDDFWRWLTSWAVCISKPADMGVKYDMPDFELPELNMIEHFLRANDAAYARANEQGLMFPTDAPSATKVHVTKRESLLDRVDEAVSIVNSIDDNQSILIWCDTNYESDALKKALPQAVDVRGSHSVKIKEERLLGFTDRDIRILITKPSVAGFGLNWQHCHEMIFVGVSYSFEKTYQALRRSWRFGQEHEVNAHIIYAETEGNMVKTLERKRKAFEIMQQEMNKSMLEYGLFRNFDRKGLISVKNEKTNGKDWSLYLGDCVDVTKQLADNCVDFGIHSPPFANLYIYSDSEADMGNSSDDDEFFQHYKYLIKDMLRITAPGRLCAVHCKDLPSYKNRDGAAGLVDFPGKIITAFEECGWQYHSRVTIWKDPVIEMQRTKNHGLLHRNFVKESNACRQGMADYMVVFRKWGDIDNQIQVKQVREVGDYIGEEPPTESDIRGWGNKPEQTNYSISVWQRYASPVWFDINQTRVLNYRQAKAQDDEKHICPLQLDVIARSIDLWSNPGDVVFSPFAGIGSEGYEAIKMGRKFLGIELKPEYYQIAINNLQDAERQANQVDLFSWAGVEVESKSEKVEYE